MFISLMFTLFLMLTNVSFAAQAFLQDEKAELASSELVDDYMGFVTEKLSYISYENFVRLLSEKAQIEPAFKELLAAATMSYPLIGGVNIGYAPRDSDIFKENEEKWLFHGTRATLDILNTWALFSYHAMSGYGMYFGVNFWTSHAYSTEESSNTHHTWSLGLTRSVLVLAKDNSPEFRRPKEHGPGRALIYISQRNQYSLDNLKHIILSTEQDVQNFKNFYLAQTPNWQQKFRDIGLYRLDYFPLTTQEAQADFKRALIRNQDLFFSDNDFVDFALMRYKSKGALLKRSTEIALKNIQNDNTALYLAAENNDLSLLDHIMAELTPKDLALALAAENSRFSKYLNKKTPFGCALANGHTSFLQTIFDHLGKDQLLLPALASAVLLDDVDHALYKKHFATIDLVTQRLASEVPAILTIAKAILSNRLKPSRALAFFEAMLRQTPTLLEPISARISTLALEALKNGYPEIARIIARNAPKSMAIKDRQGCFPLLNAALSDLHTFTTILDAAPEMLHEADNNGITVAHLALKTRTRKIRDLILAHAPKLFLQQDSQLNTPVDEAARYNSDTFIELVQTFPQALALRNRHGWTPAATAANKSDTKALEYLMLHHPDTIISDIANIAERASFNCPQMLIKLALQFDDKLPEILRAISRTYTPKEIVRELEDMARNPKPAAHN